MADKKHKVIISNPIKITFPSFKELKKDTTNYTFLENNSFEENNKVLANKLVNGLSSFMPLTAKAIVDQWNGQTAKEAWTNWGIETGKALVDSLAKIDSQKLIGLGIGIAEDFENKISSTFEERKKEWENIGEAWKNINWKSALGDGENNVFLKTLEGINNHIKDIEKFLNAIEKTVPDYDNFKISIPTGIEIDSSSINKENFASNIQVAANAVQPESLMFRDMIKQIWSTNDYFQNLFDVFFIEKNASNTTDVKYMGERPLKDWFKSAKILSARVESISLPSIQGTTTTHNFVGSAIEKRTNGMIDSHQGSFTIRGDDSLYLTRVFNQISQTNIQDTLLSTNLKKKVKGFKETFGDSVKLEDWEIVEGEVPPSYFSQNNKVFEIHIYINRANELAKRGDLKDVNGFVKNLHLAQTEVYMLKDSLIDLKEELSTLKENFQKSLDNFNKAIEDQKFEDETLKNKISFENKNSTITEDDLKKESGIKESQENENKKAAENKKAEESLATIEEAAKQHLKEYEKELKEIDKLEKENKEKATKKRTKLSIESLTTFHKEQVEREKIMKDLEKKINKIDKGYDKAVIKRVDSLEKTIEKLEKQKEQVLALEKERDKLLAKIDEINKALAPAYQPFHIEIKNVKILGTNNAISFKREGAATQSFSYNFIYRNYEIKQGESIIQIDGE